MPMPWLWALSKLLEALRSRAHCQLRKGTADRYGSRKGDPAAGVRSALLQLLGEHHDDAVGAADIGELVHVPVGRHAAQRVAAVPRGDLEGLVNIVDREGHAVHANLVRLRGLRLYRVGVDVLEELEATVTVWRLEHGDVGVVAVEADRGVGPLSTDRVTTEDGQPQVGKEDDRCFEVADGDADVLEFDGHALHAIESGRWLSSVGCRFRLNRAREHSAVSC